MPENKLPKSSEDLMKFLTDLIEGNAEIPLTEDSLKENEVLIDGTVHDACCPEVVTHINSLRDDTDTLVMALRKIENIVKDLRADTPKQKDSTLHNFGVQALISTIADDINSGRVPKEQLLDYLKILPFLMSKAEAFSQAVEINSELNEEYRFSVETFKPIASA